MCDTNCKCTTTPADWAVKAALSRITPPQFPLHWTVPVIRKSGKTQAYASAVLLAASLIEAHEQPPVDPDLLRAREAVARQQDAKDYFGAAKKTREGAYDNETSVRAVLSVIKGEA